MGIQNSCQLISHQDCTWRNSRWYYRTEIYIYIIIYIYLFLISILWHRQAIFESKGDKLSSSAECRIRTQRVCETQSSADWMPAASWHSHLALAIHIFVVVNFDALAQASDFRIERRQVVFLCWMQDSNPEGLWNPIFSRLNAHWQTDWAIEDQAKKLELDSPSLWSASIQPTWPHCHLAFAPGLWCHFAWMSSERFWVGHVRLPALIIIS